MNKNISRTVVKVVFILALLAAGIVHIIRGDAASGTGRDKSRSRCCSVTAFDPALSPMRPTATY